MRTLNEVRTEIVQFCTESDVSPAEAIAKLGPFDDLDDESREEVIAAGLTYLVGADFTWLRAHPVEVTHEDDVEGDGMRSYLGRFQLRPTSDAMARAVYANLRARYETADGKQRSLLEFTLEDWQFNKERAEARMRGWANRLELFSEGAAALKAAGKSRTSQLNKSVLSTLDELAGKALR